MREQLHRGRLKFISFILLDLLCLLLSNIIAVQIYTHFGSISYRFSDYIIVIAYMMIIDVLVTAIFNTLNKVLRRSLKREIIQSIKHVGFSLVFLTLFLFSMKQGAAFSRVTVFLAYGIYLVLIIIARSGWKEILKLNRGERQIPTALLITTTGYSREGIEVVENAGMVVKGMFITDKTNEGIIRNIPVIVGRRDATAFICWEWIDKVYICGPENIDVPDSLVSACHQMNVPVYTSPASKSFDFEVVKIRTALQKDDKSTGLSFFESEHDIPFQIRRMYTIFESEQENQKGFHAHKQSWHLLFCPYGVIDVMVDNGKERKTISMSNPSTGLILDPGIWREIVWKKPGSVLCVAASGHYDSEKLRTDYNEYLKFLQEKEWAATIEFAEIMGEVV